MPSCAVRTFTDPGDYAAAIRQGTYELIVTARAFHRETHSDRSASALDAAVLR
jgi:hypothetical protein